jgi:hypothetical protein
MPRTNPALMRDGLNRAKVPVAPCVLVQLIVATPHDTSGDEVFYAAACCVAGCFDGAHRGLVCVLLWGCSVWCVAVDGSEVDDKLCQDVTGVVFRHLNLNLC